MIYTVNLGLLKPAVLNALIVALDALPLGQLGDEAWALKHKLDEEEARRVRAGERVTYGRG